VTDLNAGLNGRPKLQSTLIPLILALGFGAGFWCWVLVLGFGAGFW
jgi:hypothetical protein